MAAQQPSSAVSRGPGRPPRSPEQRAAQRVRLLDAAMAAIRRVGPDTSVDEMAGEAGVSKPVLYAEFGDKHGIAEAVAVELTDRSQRALEEQLARSSTLDIREGVRLAIDGFVGTVMDEPEIYAFIVRSIRTNDKSLLDNALVRSLQARLEQYANLLGPGIDPALLAVITHGLFGFMVASVESWRTSQTPPRAEFVASLVDVVLAGFAAVTPSAADRRRRS